LGRFISQDPGMQGNNWFAYCNDDPVNKTDANGKKWGAPMLFLTFMLGAIVTLLGACCAGTPLGWFLLAVGCLIMIYDVASALGWGEEVNQDLKNLYKKQRSAVPDDDDGVFHAAINSMKQSTGDGSWMTKVAASQVEQLYWLGMTDG